MSSLARQTTRHNKEHCEEHCEEHCVEQSEETKPFTQMTFEENISVIYEEHSTEEIRSFC